MNEVVIYNVKFNKIGVITLDQWLQYLLTTEEFLCEFIGEL